MPRAGWWKSDRSLLAAAVRNTRRRLRRNYLDAVRNTRRRLDESAQQFMDHCARLAERERSKLMEQASRLAHVRVLPGPAGKFSNTLRVEVTIADEVLRVADGREVLDVLAEQCGRKVEQELKAVALDVLKGNLPGGAK